MILIQDTLLKRSATIVLVLYVGAFLGQALCVLHTSHMESGSEIGANGPPAHVASSMEAHAASSMETYASPSTAMYATPSMSTLGSSHHGEHSGAPEPSHSGVCAVVACGSAVTTTTDHGLETMSLVSNFQLVYLGGAPPPEAEMVLPPPRLG